MTPGRSGDVLAKRSAALPLGDFSCRSHAASCWQSHQSKCSEVWVPPGRLLKSCNDNNETGYRPASDKSSRGS